MSAVVGLNFKGDSRAHGVAARGKCSRRDVPRLETGTDLKETGGSGKPKDTLGTCGAMLSHVPVRSIGISPLTG